MITTYLMGGLGNQLFQIFNLLAYSLEYKTPFILPYSESLKTGIERPTYWNTFFKSLKPFTTVNIPKLNVIREKGFHFTEHIKNLDNIIFFGYFQSYKYFEKHFNDIKKLIGIENMQKSIKERYNDYFKNKTISLHFRLGDYKEKQDFHPIMSVEYYESAITTIMKTINDHNITILYFCEENDLQDVNEKINILKQKFTTIEFKRITNLKDWEQMILMSCCDHNIIANSTFSWWGAYLNDNRNKIVCYPNKWFGLKAGNRNMNDLCPDNWNKC